MQGLISLSFRLWLFEKSLHLMAGIDVCRGSFPQPVCDAVICTIDLLKKDSEIKILIGCTEEEKAVIMRFHNDSEFMKGAMIRRES